MINAQFYEQVCPTCGRPLSIHVEFRGETVVCRHCHADFIASDPAGDHGDSCCWRSHLVERAEELLQLEVP